MKKIFYFFSLVFILAFCVLPLLKLFWVPHWADYLNVLANDNTLKAAQNTILVSAATGFCCLLIG
ncbi:MAG: hypothetical protein ACXVAX_12755, partial [Pseudobdellovibrio sp.]